MKRRILFSLMLSLSAVCISNAQFSKALRDLKNNPSRVDYSAIHQKAFNRLQAGNEMLVKKMIMLK